MKRKIRSTMLLFVMVLSLIASAIQVSAKVNLPSISKSKPIYTYTYNSTGKAYRYTDSTLKTKYTNHWIDCATDQCRIIEIQNEAVKVIYPTSSGDQTGWFKRSDFCKGDLKADQAKCTFNATKKTTTYKWKEKETVYGSISKGDKCYLLRGDQNSNWLQVLYPVSAGYKMAWVKGSDIKKQIWPDPSTTVYPTDITLSPGSIKLTEKGATGKITATVIPSNATNKSVTWKSSNTSVATVSGGTVTAKGNGTATITATTSNNISKSITVTVSFNMTNEEAVRDRLNKIAKGKYTLNSSTVLQVGKKFVGTKSNEQCKGYAKDVFYCCFKIWAGSTVPKPNNHKINLVSGMKLVASTTSVTESSAKKLFSSARPGDFVQIRRRHSGSHSAIVYKVTSTGVTFLEANLDGHNTIYSRTYTWKALADKNAKMSVYTATSYKLK